MDTVKESVREYIQNVSRTVSVGGGRAKVSI